MPRFNKGDRVRVSLASHSPYRGQTGMVDDSPSSYSHPSTGSNSFWYMVRFDYKGLHPAARFVEDDLEAVTDEIAQDETSTDVRKTGGQIAQISNGKKYFLIASVTVLVLAGALIGFNNLGSRNSSTPPPDFSSADENPPLLTGGSSNETMKLAFAAELGEATAGTAFAIQPVVNIVDNNGNIMTTSSAPVTLTVTNNKVTLYGPTTVNAVNGVATFSELSIRFAGINYSLTAISPGLTSSISNTFSVEPGEGVKLAFVGAPAASGLASRFSASVAVLDTYGNIDTNSTVEVSLSIALGTGSPEAVLSGTATQEARDGVASFNYLSVNPENDDYQLIASSPGLTSGMSASFNVAQLTAEQEQQQKQATGQ